MSEQNTITAILVLACRASLALLLDPDAEAADADRVTTMLETALADFDKWVKS